jgi:hypothetical protein
MKEFKRHALTHKNPYPICAGLELSVPQSGEGSDDFWLNAEIVFGQQPLSGEGVSFRLGVKTGFLKLQLENCRIVPGSRHAMLDQPASVHREVREEQTQTDVLKGEGTAEVKLAATARRIGGQAEISGKTSGSRVNERTTYTKREGGRDLRKITGRGTNSEPSWEICDPDRVCLDGRYLGMENLCQIVTASGSYRIVANFICQKRNLALLGIECGGLHRFTPNKEKLALAMIAKRLGTGSDGEIELCQSILTLIPANEPE